MAAGSFLVTGAAGFVGSHVVESLLAASRRVTAVVRRTSRAQVLHDFENLSDVVDHPLLEIRSVDLAGPSAVEELAAVDADVWMHLAADAFVSASLSQPAAVVTNNVISTLNVLEAARRAEPRTVLTVSSSEVYGSNAEPITEAFPLEPSTPYAASKAAAERLAASYFSTFGVPVVVARPFNCYGPRHTYDAVPIFIRRAVARQPLEVTGDGAQSRDLTYVTDTVDALVMLAEANVHGEVFNIGTGLDTSTLRLAQLVCEIADSESEIRMVPDRAGDVRRLCADAGKLRRRLGWRPMVTLEDGLRRNIEWYCSRQARSCTSA